MTEPLPIEALYVEYRHLLLFVAMRKFRIPADEAEALLHDVLLSFINCGPSVRDHRAWLVAAICNASRTYLRTHSCEEDREDDPFPSTTDMESFERRIVVAEILAALPPRDRELLRLHYAEGMTSREIAARMRLHSVGYTEKVLSKALRRARAAYRSALCVTERRKSLPVDEKCAGAPSDAPARGYRINCMK